MIRLIGKTLVKLYVSVFMGNDQVRIRLKCHHLTHLCHYHLGTVCVIQFNFHVCFVFVEVACIPQCLNGGTCLMGKCYCPDSFTGPACLQRSKIYFVFIVMFCFVHACTCTSNIFKFVLQLWGQRGVNSMLTHWLVMYLILICLTQGPHGSSKQWVKNVINTFMTLNFTCDIHVYAASTVLSLSFKVIMNILLNLCLLIDSIFTVKCLIFYGPKWIFVFVVSVNRLYC